MTLRHPVPRRFDRGRPLRSRGEKHYPPPNINPKPPITKSYP